ncbi:hypothetical protein Bpfe_022130 [Biomphalaria pfeifferi]|uniref:Fibronectin type-III domain-containing protein n=1 Tax=Biomphalaria pfeifferi TaxID=112525 RepID=A0AAD8F267_BIOPF|nr:hypothetical protein Bpfe_022130 [Biomphalaria pfeifferi]
MLLCLVFFCISFIRPALSYSGRPEDGRPENVTNLVCYLYDWIEYIQCTWDHPPRNKQNMDNIEVDFIYNSDPSILRVVRCPELTKTSCVMAFTGSYVYTIQISVINTITNGSVDHIFSFLPSKHVKPAPVEDLKAFIHNGSLQVTWHHPKIYWTKTFQIFLQTHSRTTWMLYKYGWPEEKLIIDELKPYTSINISVLCCPEKGFCSEPSNISSTTPAIAPPMGPGTVNGSYRAGSCKNHQLYRHVTLFWQDVLEILQYGPLEGFTLNDGTRELHVTNGSKQATIQLPCHTRASVQIFAKNPAGYSTRPTVMSVAPDLFRVPENLQKSLIVELNRTSVFIHWNRDVNEIYEYVLFYCADPPESRFADHCKTTINRQQLPRGDSEITLPYASLLGDNSNWSLVDLTLVAYRFGLAMYDKLQDLTSPIFWAECYYNLTAALDDVKIDDVIPGDESVTVSWNVLKCLKSPKIKITQYVLLYCIQHLCDSPNTVEMSSTGSFYTIRHLQADQKYQVAVVAQSYDRIANYSIKWRSFQPLTVPKCQQKYPSCRTNDYICLQAMSTEPTNREALPEHKSSGTVTSLDNKRSRLKTVIYIEL